MEALYPSINGKANINGGSLPQVQTARLNGGSLPQVQQTRLNVLILYLNILKLVIIQTNI